MKNKRKLLEETINNLKTALEFYADENLYKNKIMGYEMYYPIENDKGNVAKQALKDFEEAPVKIAKFRIKFEG